MGEGTFYARRGKRWLDICLASVLLPAALPLLAAGALLVWLGLGRPVLFRQRRAGLHGQVWDMTKLRTMRDGPMLVGGAVDRARTPPLGRLLRRAKIDELFQLFDVLAGRLSFVGPRALPPEVVARMAPQGDPRLVQRHALRPGLTGWAQVCGGTLLTDPEKLALDCAYVRHVSLRHDLEILWRTLGVLLQGESRDEAALRRAQAEG
jgi:lipopolysaccharide/colanic/teichoic acid biosynthesis glycosyltransferase